MKRGDFIVISEISGVGRAFDEQSNEVIDIIGMACESSSDEGIKRVKVKLGH